MGAPNGDRSSGRNEEGISPRSAGAASVTNAWRPRPSSILKARVEVESSPGMPAFVGFIAVQLVGTFRRARPIVTVRDASAASPEGEVGAGGVAVTGRPVALGLDAVTVGATA